MKNIIRLLLLILIAFGCNNDPKQEETKSVDTIAMKRTPPPDGLGRVETQNKVSARALAPGARLDSTVITKGGDTVRYYTETRTGTGTTTYTYSYVSQNVVIKNKSTTTPVPPPPPTGTSKYLLFPKSGKINATSGQVIENLIFENMPDNAIYVRASNVTIRNCFFNKAGAEAIVLEGATNITIENCLFNGVTTGVYALSSQTVKVRNNQFVNVRQRSGGGRGQFVQFNGVTGAGNLVENNKGENFPGESDPEDLVSLFKSSGTLASPISVRFNMFRGGGPSASGGGIMSGDYGGSYQIVEGNTLLDPGQYGLGVAGGSNISILNNKVFARQQTFTNNPMYVWAQQGASCSNIIVKGNRVNWTDKSGSKNNGWNAGNCGNTSFEYPTTISLIEMGVPTHLIDFISPTELLTIRK